MSLKTRNLVRSSGFEPEADKLKVNQVSLELSSNTSLSRHRAQIYSQHKQQTEEFELHAHG